MLCICNSAYEHRQSEKKKQKKPRNAWQQQCLAYCESRVRFNRAIKIKLLLNPSYTTFLPFRSLARTDFFLYGIDFCKRCEQNL